MSMDGGYLPGWGDIPDAPLPPSAPVANGDLDGFTEALDPMALVQLIAANPEALEALGKALEPKQKKDHLRCFATVDEWVEEYLLEVWRHRLQGDRIKWCDSWALHRQASVELTWLWDSWEEHRKVPSSMIAWNVHYNHPTMDRLLDPTTSPFDGCTHSGNGRTAHHDPSQERLPVELFPGLFPVHPTKANPHPEQ